MNQLLESKKLNEMIYELVLGRFWTADDMEKKNCSILLVRCLRSFGEVLKELHELIQSETGTDVSYCVDAEKHQAAFLFFGVNWNQAHYTSLKIKLLISSYAEDQFSLMLASIGENSHRNPAFFQELTNLFEQVPLQPNVFIFHDLYRSNETQCILIVEGDEHVSRYLQLRMRLKGYRVITARDGKQGLELFREERPDLVITDLNLTGIDGFHFLTCVNSENPDGPSKIVVFTENRAEEAISKCFQLGIADYITHPFSPVEVEARLVRLLKKTAVRYKEDKG